MSVERFKILRVIDVREAEQRLRAMDPDCGTVAVGAMGGCAAAARLRFAFAVSAENRIALLAFPSDDRRLEGRGVLLEQLPNEWAREFLDVSDGDPTDDGRSVRRRVHLELNQRERAARVAVKRLARRLAGKAV